MSILDDLFTFPIIMVDGEKEEQKEKASEMLALSNDNSVDIIEGQAECPYDDFLSISDRWLPTDDSYNRALNEGIFDACQVTFSQSGSYVVPWNKERFKKKLQEFIDSKVKVKKTKGGL